MAVKRSNGAKSVGCGLYVSRDLCRTLYIFVFAGLLLCAFFAPVSAGDVRIGANVYSTINEALAVATPGSTIVVYGGVYPENIEITKAINLAGVASSDGKKPIINTQKGNYGVLISGSDSTFEGFTVNGNAVCAVLVSGDNCNILNNDIEETPLGITLYSSAGTTVARNTISGHRVGIYVDDSVDCAIYLNDFENIVNGKSVSNNIRWSTTDLVYGYKGNYYTSTLGNFWNDYYGSSDPEISGIGEKPYDPYGAGQYNMQNQLILNNINLQNLASSGRFWKNLFYTGNNLVDSSPLISHNAEYTLYGPAGTVIPDETPAETPAVTPAVTPAPTQTPQVSPTEKADNGTTTPDIPVIIMNPNATYPFDPSDPSNPGYVIVPGDPNYPQGSDYIYDTNASFRPGRPTRVVFMDQSPFEIVFILMIISGITAGLTALSFDFGSLAAVRMKRGLEILFFELVYAGLAVALLYSFISYTSRVIYQYVSSGYAEVGFLLLTAYIISSSLIISFGFFRSKVPIGLFRIQPILSILALAVFVLVVWNTDVVLGPITGIVYPASLLLSAAVPVVFGRMFADTVALWKFRSSGNSLTKYVSGGIHTGSGSHSDDETVLFIDENNIMSTSLGSSYFPEVLNERYYNVEFIGKGGIARVFKAQRRTDDKVVAVKVPINFDEATGRMFMKEMKIWDGLEHPNIVRFYSVNILPIPFVEMEYVPRALSDMEKPMPPSDAYKIILGIARGLSYAHARQIIHRDIKPQNILIAEDNTPKITDWGLGKIVGDGNANETTTVGFSLNYASPEQIAPKKYGMPTKRTDIYQLGILFYELITGTRPFFGDGVADMSDEILYKEPVKPSERVAEGAVFDDIIMKMIAKNPDDRYQSVDDMIADLVAAWESHGGAAEKTTAKSAENATEKGTENATEKVTETKAD